MPFFLLLLLLLFPCFFISSFPVPQLEELRLGGCARVGGDVSFLAGLPDLEALELDGCAGVRGDLAAALAAAAALPAAGGGEADGGALVYLSCVGCRELRGNVLGALAEHW